VESSTAETLDAKLRAGDAHALAELFAANRERLWRMVRFRLDARLANRVDPDDILQEAYVAAAQRLSHYAQHPNASPFVWLRLIVKQTLVDVHRRNLLTQRRDADRERNVDGWTADQTSASLAVCLVGSWTSPSQAAARDELLATVRQAIATMDPLDQEVLALRHFEELTNGEVAEVLGLQVKAASIRYIRALQRLKELLAASCPTLLEEIQHG